MTKKAKTDYVIPSRFITDTHLVARPPARGYGVKPKALTVTNAYVIVDFGLSVREIRKDSA